MAACTMKIDTITAPAWSRNYQDGIRMAPVTAMSVGMELMASSR
jgi:hypothetical protein